MFNKITKQGEQIAVIGLGYVGLPIALEFAKKIPVIGFDINDERIELMKQNIDPGNELPSKSFENCNIKFTSSSEDLCDACGYIIAVPTPIDEYMQPDLTPLLNATETVGRVINKGDYVIYESTVYPGCTEEDCVPLLEKISGLKYILDFKVGFSPERINPGDKIHTLKNITKVVSGCDKEALENIALMYEMIIDAGVYKAQSIKIAEAAKIIENTQRDINIAFMNELSIIFNLMNINTYDVLKAAETKWNFLPFSPGLVGGHCIGVDPYYLLHKANEFGYHSQIIGSGRAINDGMGAYVAKETVKKIINTGKNIKETNVLIMGITFKENVSDIRNSRVIDVINELKSFMINVDVIDPFASEKEVNEYYGINLSKKLGKHYDGIILAVPHQPYKDFNEEYFQSICSDKAIFVDIKGVFREKIKKLTYWSL